MKKTIRTQIVTVLGLLSLSLAAQAQAPTIAQKVERLLQQMTLEEKAGQLNQYSSFWEFTGPVPAGSTAERKLDELRKGRVGSMLNVKGAEATRNLQRIAVEETRLHIPLLFGFDVIHGFKTISPIPLAEAASWNLELVERSAQIAAEEASAAGIHWTFAPMLDVARDARWGRVMEGSGEDPYLVSRMGEARIYGFQGRGTRIDNKHVLACAKHFAGYGFVEAGRDYNRVDVSDETLHNVILPPFEAAVKAGVKTVMNAFNDVGGIPATAHRYLQRDWLKGRLGYKGMVVSDWGSIQEMVPHGYASDLADAARMAMLAGSDMDMESEAYVQHIPRWVKQGKIPQALLDDAVRRILTLKFELGLFDNPYAFCDPKREQESTGRTQDLKDLLELAKQSVVLLKNEGHLLPLPTSGKKIALIGPLVRDKTSPLGSWRIAASDETAVSVWEGLQAYPNHQYLYAQGAPLVQGQPQFVLETHINTTDTSGFAQALEVARQAEVVIMVLGEHGLQSGEGRSRTQLGLPGVQQQLLEAVYAVNPNIVLVLQNGRPLVLSWAHEHIPAIVEAWHLGTTSGTAIAQILMGDHNPGGRLPMSFPRNEGQLPLYYAQKSTGRPAAQSADSVFWSHYTDQDNTPLYPFGYGLSYTQFQYGPMSLSQTRLKPGQKLQVQLTITNSGQRSGCEVVQLYLRDRVGSYTRPVKELKGFQRLLLAPGQSQNCTFTLTEADLAYYTANHRYEAETGTFEVWVGPDAAHGQMLTFEFDR